MSRWAAVVAAILILPLSGCFEPYRVHVDPRVLAESHLGWRESVQAMRDSGFLGTKQQETDYDVRAGGAPPAHLEVFSIRSPQDPGLGDLLNRSRQELGAYAQRSGLAIDHSQDRRGERVWDSGVHTLYYTTQGTATSNGLFTLNYKVRFVAEVGHDGISSTSILALGVAQVQVSRECPIVGNCQPQDDARSWVELVGDPAGTVDNAIYPHGFLQSLVTH